MLNLFKRKEKGAAKKEKLACDICNMELRDRHHLDKHKKIAHPKGR